jgi:hypothetical protein
MTAPTKGKYNNLRDSLLHFLCENGWANRSSGDVESPTGYFWLISLTWEDVKPENTEFTSLIEEWLTDNYVPDVREVREAIEGTWIIVENSDGLVFSFPYVWGSEGSERYTGLVAQYNEWADQDDE